jgi:hypothetical protein
LIQTLTEHLGHDRHYPAGQGLGNIGNRIRSKTVLTDTTGPVSIDAPRDRAGTFEPRIVRRRRRRLTGVDEIVLYAKGQGGQAVSRLQGLQVIGPYSGLQLVQDDSELNLGFSEFAAPRQHFRHRPRL